MVRSICYRIRDDRRRLQTVTLLKDRGERIQFAVCRAILKPEELARLKERVNALLDPAEDTLRFHPLCAGCAARIEIPGEGRITQDPEFIVI